MSGRLSGKVWDSDLSPRLKPLAATLADFASESGCNIYPSVELIAWRLGMSKRSVQYGLRELRALGVLEVVDHAAGGRGKSVNYRMIETKLPIRQPFRSTRRGATFLPAARKNDASPDPKQRNPRDQSMHVVSSDTLGTIIKTSAAAPSNVSQDAMNAEAETVEKIERLPSLVPNPSSTKNGTSLRLAYSHQLRAEVFSGIFRKTIENVFFDLRDRPLQEQLDACVREAITSLMLNRVGKMMNIPEHELLRIASLNLRAAANSFAVIQDFTQRCRYVAICTAHCVTEAATALYEAFEQSLRY